MFRRTITAAALTFAAALPASALGLALTIPFCITG